MPDSAPIFVDDTGRRRRRVRSLATIGTVVSFGYLFILGATMIGIPGLGGLPLPGVGDLRGPTDEMRSSVGDRTIEEDRPELLIDAEPEAVSTETTSTSTSEPAGDPPTSAALPSPVPTSGPTTTAGASDPGTPTTAPVTTTTPPGQGSTTTTVTRPGRGPSSSAPSTTPTSSPGQGGSPPSTAPPR